MKKFLFFLLITIVIFSTLTITTAKIETPVDGNDTYGFPLTFFERFSLMCDPCPPEPTAINYLYLLIDSIVSLLVALAFWALYGYGRKKWRKKSTPY